MSDSVGIQYTNQQSFQPSSATKKVYLVTVKDLQNFKKTSTFICSKVLEKPHGIEAEGLLVETAKLKQLTSSEYIKYIEQAKEIKLEDSAVLTIPWHQIKRIKHVTLTNRPQQQQVKGQE